MVDNALPILMGLLAAVCVFFIVAIALEVMYLLTLHRCMNLTSRRNRTMEPGLVWLNLVPLISIYWPIHIAIHVCGTLKNEFRDRDIDDGSDYGKGIGLAVGITNLVGVLFNLVGTAMAAANPPPQPQRLDANVLLGNQPMAINIVVWTLSLISLVCWVVFWVRIAGYKRQLEADDLLPPRDRYDDRDDRDDRDDDFPRSLPDKRTDIEARRQDDRYSP